MKTIKDRPSCKICGNPNGWNRGQGRYVDLCAKHYRKKYNIPHEPKDRFKRKFDNTTCCICGWNKAPCDRHKLDRKIGYLKGNVIVVCPNCHRMIHQKKLKVDVSLVILGKEMCEE